MVRYINFRVAHGMRNLFRCCRSRGRACLQAKFAHHVVDKPLGLNKGSENLSGSNNATYFSAISERASASSHGRLEDSLGSFED